MATTDRRIVSKKIALIEKQGGLIPLPCGCILSVQVKELRKIIEINGPKEVLDILNKLQCWDHPIKIKKKSGKSKT